MPNLKSVIVGCVLSLSALFATAKQEPTEVFCQAYGQIAYISQALRQLGKTESEVLEQAKEEKVPPHYMEAVKFAVNLPVEIPAELVGKYAYVGCKATV